MIDNFAMIIGAMKAGTTSLFSYLAEHPQVCPARVKEPDFFTRPPPAGDELDAYRQLWRWRPRRHHVALEASTSYTKQPRFPDAAQRVARLAARFRFIYMLRNPLQRIESHYNHGFRDGWLALDLAERPDVDPHAIAVSSYAMQLDAYARVFVRRDILLLSFEEFVRDPLRGVARVCAFLEIDADFPLRPQASARNPSNRVDHPSYRWATRQSWLRAPARLLPTRYKEALRNRLAARRETTFRLSARQRAQVCAALRDDLRRLRDEYGFDTSAWQCDA